MTQGPIPDPLRVLADLVEAVGPGTDLAAAARRVEACLERGLGLEDARALVLEADGSLVRPGAAADAVPAGDEARRLAALRAPERGGTLTLPLLSGERLVGLVRGRVVAGPGALGDGELLAIGRAAAAAFEHASLFESTRRRADELELVVGEMTDGVITCDDRLAVVRVNAAARQISWGLGGDPGAVGTKLLTLSADGSEVPFDALPLVRAVRTGEVVRNRELVLRNAGTGEERSILVSASPLRDGSGRTVGGVAVLRDATEQHARLAHVARTEKLRVVGELAASVAHELNNVLAAVLGRAEVVLGATREAETRRNAEVILGAARDAKQVLGRLTRMAHHRARGQTPGIRIDVVQVASDAVELTRPRWSAPKGPAAIAVELDVRERRVLVVGVAAELREVLTNLILNAVDAMPGGGSIRISIGRREGRVAVEVSDTGAGMTDDVLKHLFEPFFTTKGEAGTGLGLNISSAIVSAHGGRIDARSVPGKGTTILVELPAIESDATPPQPARALPDRRRILVVDDDARVRGVLVDLLAAEGHAVEAAASGEDALALVLATETPFDALVTDLAMPGMSGMDLAEEVKARVPRTAVVVVSGWAAGASSEALVRLGASVVTKPFVTEDVRVALADAFRRV